MSVGLLLNMSQWISEIKVENIGKELQSNFGFFVCVWMIPMLLSLSLELTWESATESGSGVSNKKDSEEPDAEEFKKKSSMFGSFQKYFMQKRNQVLVL